MKKWLWRILLGVSSCLLVAVSILWARSFTHGDGIDWLDHHSDHGIPYYCEGGVRSVEGRVWFSTFSGHDPDRVWYLRHESRTELRWANDGPSRYIGPYELDLVVTSGDTYWWNSLGFYARHTRSANGLWYWWWIQAPHWFLVALFSIPLLIQCRRWYIRRGRYKTGLCQTCGYDLRASVDRCPECGTAIELACAAAGAENPSSI